jgi:S1-C subfamily serine protease
MVGDRITIPVLKPGDNLREPKEAQVETDAASQKLYEDVFPTLVQMVAVTCKQGDSACPTGDKIRTGSGFFIDDAGRVATASHVVLDAKEIYAVSNDGKKYVAKIERLSESADVAQLKLEKFDVKNQKFLKLADDAKLQSEQKLYAFGFPKGNRPAYLLPGEFKSDVLVYDLVNKDALAMKFKTATAEEKKLWLDRLSRSMVQAEVHLEQGVSGGPLVDKSGKLIGIADSMSDTNHSNSFFVRAEELRRLMREPARILDPSGDSKTFNWKKFK